MRVKWLSVMLLSACLLVPALAEELKSGLQKGEAVPAYNPLHVAGPDKGTNVCPV